MSSFDIKFNQEWEVIVAPPPYEEVVGIRQMEKPVQVHSTPFQLDPLGIEQDVTPVREVEFPPIHTNLCLIAGS